MGEWGSLVVGAFRSGDHTADSAIGPPGLRLVLPLALHIGP